MPRGYLEEQNLSISNPYEGSQGVKPDCLEAESEE